MRVKALDGRGGYAFVLEPGEEVVAWLSEFAKRNDIRAAGFTAIGVVSGVSWGYYDRDKGDYEKTTVDKEAEVLSLLGNLSLNEGQPLVHAHITVAGRDGVARGGHLFEAHVWPTLEVFVTTYPEAIARRPHPELGFALFSF